MLYSSAHHDFHLLATPFTSIQNRIEKKIEKGNMSRSNRSQKRSKVTTNENVTMNIEYVKFIVEESNVVFMSRFLFLLFIITELLYQIPVKKLITLF